MALVDPNGGEPDATKAVKILEDNLAKAPSRVLSPAGRMRVPGLRKELEGFLKNVPLVAPSVPVVNNVDVKVETDPGRIKDALVRQAASPVRWVEIIRSMAAQGVTHVVECGPGKVLAGLVKRIEPKLLGIAAADRASLETALAAIRGK